MNPPAEWQEINTKSMVGDAAREARRVALNEEFR
jgi:hypothetical protein